MKDIQLIVPLDKLDISQDSLPIIYGEIYFRVKEFYFPYEQSRDSVVELLSWWIQNLGRAPRDKVSVFDFLFYQPFVIRVNCNINDCNLKFFEGYGNTGTLIGEATVERSELMANLISVAESVIVAANKKQWNIKVIGDLTKTAEKYKES